MTRVPSAETTWRSWEPAEPPAIGVIGGRESSSTHMGGSLGREGSRGSAGASTGGHFSDRRGALRAAPALWWAGTKLARTARTHRLPPFPPLCSLSQRL